MSAEDRTKLAGALHLLAIAKLPAVPMSEREEDAWRAGFEAGAHEMLRLIERPGAAKGGGHG